MSLNKLSRSCRCVERGHSKQNHVVKRDIWRAPWFSVLACLKAMHSADGGILISSTNSKCLLSFCQAILFGLEARGLGDYRSFPDYAVLKGAKTILMQPSSPSLVAIPEYYDRYDLLLSEVPITL